MENIHVLPTDKPSELYINIQGELSKSNSLLLRPKSRNIYITSDEEIKEGDWCYDSYGKQILQFNNRVGVLLANQQKERYGNKSFFKIILTTDQDLIKDGVQAIPDDFLEWFVKHPTCEYIEIENKFNTFLNGDKRSVSDFRKKYKIIIPKEEPKETTIDWSGFPKSTQEKVGYIESKQETLEEAAENYGWRIKRNTFSDAVKTNELAESSKQDFIAGSKWQAERMYSEEEVGELLYNVIGEYGKHYGIMIDGKMLNDLFEQIKKK